MEKHVRYVISLPVFVFGITLTELFGREGAEGGKCEVCYIVTAEP